MDLLRLHVAFRDTTSTLAFRRFPVRLGRDDTNDCRLDFGFVSRRHATVGVENGHILLRDEGSLTGTWVHGGTEPIAPQTDVDLGAYGNEFSIGALRFRAELLTGAGADEVVEADDLLENLGSEDFETRQYAEARVNRESLELDVLEDLLRAALKRTASAHRGLVDVLQSAQNASPDGRKRLAEILVGEEPEWDGRAALRRFVTASDVRPAPARLEETALRVLQELAAFYVPYGPPLTGAEAVVEFAQRIDDLVSAVVDGLEGLHGGAPAGDLPGAPRGPGRRAERVAMWLDWTRGRGGIRALRAELAKIVGASGLLGCPA